MKKTINEKSLTVFNYLMDHDGENKTSADIAADLGLATKSVDGIVTAGLQRKGYTERVPAVIDVTDDNGTTVPKKVNFIRLTPAGRAYDHAAAQAADAAEAANA
jgi:DNA-binding MarR family transcriptional regulator